MLTLGILWLTATEQCFHSEVFLNQILQIAPCQVNLKSLFCFFCRSLVFSRSMCMTICRIMLFFFLAIGFPHRAVPSPQPLTCLKEGRKVESLPASLQVNCLTGVSTLIQSGFLMDRARLTAENSASMLQMMSSCCNSTAGHVFCIFETGMNRDRYIHLNLNGLRYCLQIPLGLAA